MFAGVPFEQQGALLPTSFSLACIGVCCLLNSHKFNTLISAVEQSDQTRKKETTTAPVTQQGVGQMTNNLYLMSAEVKLTSCFVFWLFDCKLP